MTDGRYRRGPNNQGGNRASCMRAFLPMTARELQARGWSQIDVLLISGDAYVDHPSFGVALVGRLLEARGYRVGIVAQPRWDSIHDLVQLGRPRLAVGVTAGNLDSMLNKLTAQKKVRSEDPYSPGGRAGLRPNRATIVYANLARQAFPGVPILLGGIEASLRRIAHYDYWSDRVRRSVVLDAKADLLLFGMAERALTTVLARLDAGEPVDSIRDVPGTAYALSPKVWPSLPESRFVGDGGYVKLPSYEQVASDKLQFARMTRLVQGELNPANGRPLLQPHADQAVVVQPPSPPLPSSELDALYELPFMRAPHPSYTEPIPALETVRDSLTVTRGCFGGCAFCSITEHQGRQVQSRSVPSVLREVRQLQARPSFRGVLSDVGGPTANMYGLRCASEAIEQRCRRSSCLCPRICARLQTDHGPYLKLLRAVRAMPGIRHVFVASGIRYDLALRSPSFIEELAAHHTGGQLSVAPEHTSASVLKVMRKPGAALYEQFAAQFEAASRRAGRNQHLVPYFISGHPGCTLADMVQLALYLKRRGLRPRQVQDFIPTPMSVATAMYYTGLDPMTEKPVACARDLRDKKLHKALLLYWEPSQQALVREALRQAGRADLIGRAASCLVPPGSASDGCGPARLRARVGWWGHE